MRIVVIDDEPLVAGAIAEGLRMEGGQVTIAVSGVEGLEAIEHNLPEAVFLDIVMPGMDGIEVLRRIREKHPDLPVIILSGWATEQQLEAARKLGVTDVVEKPVPLKNLARAVSRIRKS